MSEPKYKTFRDLRSVSKEVLKEEKPTPSPADSQVAGPPLSPSGGQTPRPQKSVAPERDFNRRANSIERDAMPSGMFPGTSKKLYDALYLRTRGAIKPTRMLRATKKDLTLWSGIKNRKTIDAHLRYFDMVGLVRREWILGQNEGYQFEVILPEELGIGDMTPLVVRPLEGSDQKLVRGSDQKLGSGGQTQTVDKISTSDAPKTFKTSLKNFDDDDAALAGLRTLERELTGKNSATPAQWDELVDVLATELRIAAARTTVSNVPTFLAEHLRRRLWKVDKQRAAELVAGDTAQGTAAPVPLSTEEGKKCPDCAGVGFWYPEGPEKGVAKCKHLKLKSDRPEKGTE